MLNKNLKVNKAACCLQKHPDCILPFSWVLKDSEPRLKLKGIPYPPEFIWTPRPFISHSHNRVTYGGESNGTKGTRRTQEDQKSKE